MKNFKIWSLVAVVGASGMFGACNRAGGEFQGREYMPDMAHSIAYEANVYGYYVNNRWGSIEEYRKAAEPRTPMDGTVAHKATRWNFRAEKFAKMYPKYHYQNTEEDRTLAIQEITENPIKPSAEHELTEVLDKGKFLYNTYCATCHGEKGDGNGKLWNNGSGPYKAAPANYLTDDLIKSTDGRYYHAIMHGKNKMLSHADKLSFEERWMVIHYIRSLQAAKLGGKYDLAAATGINQAPPKAEEEKKEEAKDEKKEAKATDKKEDKKKGGK